MSRTRITLDGSVLGWGAGGISRYLCNVLEHLGREPDLDVEILANSKRKVADIPGIKERDIRLKGGVLWRSTVLEADLFLRRPDVYWLPTISPPPIIPHPYVVTVHDFAPVIFPGTKRSISTLAFKTAYRRAVVKADHVLAVSQATSRDLENLWGVPADRITVTPLGVSTAFKRGDTEGAKRQVADRFGLATPFALVVGTIEKRKGLDLAVDIAAASTEPMVVFAGRNGYGHESVVASGTTAGARFLGEVTEEDLVTLYRCADVLLVPSIYEGFGLSALEAMACGCPVVVAGGAGSLGDIYGDAAKVVNDRSTEAWLSAVKEVRSDRERFADAGTRLASTHTWGQTAASTADVLRKVGSTGGGRRN